MATASANQIWARARTIASQAGIDANQSIIIDSLGGLEALLNHSIREIFRRKASDVKFRHDITTKNTIAISSGVGAVPDQLMREFLHLADITDTNNSLVAYLNYSTDAQETFTQLGYAWLVDDELHYRAPSPDLDTYSGNLYVTCPVFPILPSNTGDPVTFPSDATIDDIVLFLSQAIIGNEKFEVVSA